MNKILGIIVILLVVLGIIQTRQIHSLKKEVNELQLYRSLCDVRFMEIYQATNAQAGVLEELIKQQDHQKKLRTF